MRSLQKVVEATEITHGLYQIANNSPNNINNSIENVWRNKNFVRLEVLVHIELLMQDVHTIK